MRGLQALRATHPGSSDRGIQTTPERAILVPTEGLLVLWERAGAPTPRGPSLLPDQLYRMVAFSKSLEPLKASNFEVVGGTVYLFHRFIAGIKWTIRCQGLRTAQGTEKASASTNVTDLPKCGGS